MTAFVPNPDGEGTLLRLWEQSGTTGPLAVTLPAALQVTKAQPVNLRGEKAGPAISVSGGKLTIERMPAYAPASFLLE